MNYRHTRTELTSANLLTDLPFAACYVYSPQGKSPVSVSSRRMRDALKGGNQDAISRMAQRVHQLVGSGQFTSFFHRNMVFVPVPGSAPSNLAATLKVSGLICNSLRELGLGLKVGELITRVERVQKSAIAAKGTRPNAKVHYDSIVVESSIERYEDLLLVDDVVTRGCTLMGCALRLQEAYPDAQISAFAMLRTKSLIPDVEKVLDPCEGHITLRADYETDRDP